jgi:hypothetical protein
MKVPQRIFLDLETVPSTKVVPEGEYPPKPTVDDVKLGRMVDADKIKKKIREDMPKLIAEWEAKCKKIDEVSENDLRKESLNSLQGKILMMAYAYDDEPVQIIKGKEDLILDILNDNLRSFGTKLYGSSLIGYNIRNFDLEWIFHRALKYRKAFLPDLLKHIHVIDLMEDIKFNRYSKNYYKLDDVCKFLGIGSKTEGISGALVFDYWRDGKIEEIEQYVARDVELTRNLFNHMQL